MLHKTAQERYTKLKKVFARLKSNFNRDDLDDFIQTAIHYANGLSTTPLLTAVGAGEEITIEFDDHRACVRG